MLSWIRKLGVQAASWMLAAAPMGPLYKCGAICVIDFGEGSDLLAFEQAAAARHVQLQNGRRARLQQLEELILGREPLTCRNGDAGVPGDLRHGIFLTGRDGLFKP